MTISRIFPKKYYKYIVILVVVALLFSPPVIIESLWLREAINSGHSILFVLLSFVLYSQVNVRRPQSRPVIKYLFVIITCFIVGVMIELLQTAVHREASLDDLYGNSFGIMAGICLHAAIDQQSAHRRKIIAALFVISSMSFLLAGMAPLIQLSWHYLERKNAFPVIVDLESNWSTSFVHHDKGDYPGLSIIEPEPDWSGYRTLKLSLQSNNKTDIDLVVRIHDRAHTQEYIDRFNMKLTIAPGFNEIHIPVKDIRNGPAERELSMNHISGVILYSSKTDEWKKISVSNISLK